MSSLSRVQSWLYDTLKPCSDFLPKATIELCSTHANDASALRILFSSLILISKLFYSLNFQVSFIWSLALSLPLYIHSLPVKSAFPSTDSEGKSIFLYGLFCRDFFLQAHTHRTVIQQFLRMVELGKGCVLVHPVKLLLFTAVRVFSLFWVYNKNYFEYTSQIILRNYAFMYMNKKKTL